MIVDSTLLITGRQTPVLLQPIDQPFDPLAETVEGPITGTGPICILLPRDGETDTVASQVLPHLPTPVSLVPHQTTRSAFQAPTPDPFHGSACHQGFEGQSFVPLTRREDQRYQRAPAFRAEMDFRTEAALTATERFGLGVPAVGPSRMVVRADDGAIHIMDIPVQVPCGVGLLLARGTEASPDACLAPAVEAAGNGLPGAIPFGDSAPGSAGAEEPEDAVEDAAVVSGWAACMRFLWRKQGLSPLPLGISKVMSVHPEKYTGHNRVCKHALVLVSDPAMRLGAAYPSEVIMSRLHVL
jgi:hypothetical protein